MQNLLLFDLINRMHRNPEETLDNLWKLLFHNNNYSALLVLGEADHIKKCGLIDQEQRQFYDEVSGRHSIFYILTDPALHLPSSQIISDISYSRVKYELLEEEKERLLVSMSRLCREICQTLEIPYANLPVAIVLDHEDSAYSVIELGSNPRDTLGNLYYDYYTANRPFFINVEEQQELQKQLEALQGANEIARSEVSQTELQIKSLTDVATSLPLMKLSHHGSFKLLPQNIKKSIADIIHCIMGRMSHVGAKRSLSHITTDLCRLLELSNPYRISNGLYSLIHDTRDFPFLYQQIMKRIDQRFTAIRANNLHELTIELNYIMKSVDYQTALVEEISTLPLSELACKDCFEIKEIEDSINDVFFRQNELLQAKSRKLTNMTAEILIIENEMLRNKNEARKVEYIHLKKLARKMGAKTTMSNFEKGSESILDHPVAKLVLDITKKILLPA